EERGHLSVPGPREEPTRIQWRRRPYRALSKSDCLLTVPEQAQALEARQRSLPAAAGELRQPHAHETLELHRAALKLNDGSSSRRSALSKTRSAQSCRQWSGRRRTSERLSRDRTALPLIPTS